jgi:signal transduction histidine kinase
VRSLLEWLIAAGTPGAAERGLERQIRLTNQLSLLAGALYIGGTLSDLLMPSSWMRSLDAFAMLAHFSLPLLNRAGFFVTSRISLMLLANSVIFLATAAEGPGSGMQYLFPTFVGLPLVLFDLRERVPLVLGVALPLGCFVALEVVGYQALLPVWMHLPTSRAIFWDSVFSAFAFSFLTVLYFLVANQRVERRLEDHQGKMIASSKLTALGEMAAGVAHEINNPLGILFLLTSRLGQLSTARPPDAAALGKLTVDVQANLERIADVVSSLRAFSRDGAADASEPVSVERIVEDALGFYRQRLRNHEIELRLRSVSTEVEVPCRAVEITQIVVNLLSNAHDAVLRSSRVERWIEVAVLPADAQVEIHVSDSGDGVHREIRDKLFQPFFTTKPVGKGTGLGLSVSLGLAQAHGGNLQLDSAAPVTRFVLSLPRGVAHSG